MTESHPNPPAPAAAPIPPRQKPPAVRPMLFILAVFVGVMAVAAASKYFVGPERVAWRGDLAAAMAESQQANKPVLLYFTAEWCGPCQYMRRNVFTDAGVGRAIEQRYIPVRIDHDQRQDLISQYQVEAIPWFAVLDAEGRPVRKLEQGVQTPQELIAWLER